MSLASSGGPACGPKTRSGKHDQVMLTAARLFMTAGYSGTSMEDLAVAVGVTKGALYHYFATKSDILYSIYQLVVDLITERFDNHPVGADPRQRLRLMIQDMLEMIENHPIELAVYLQEGPLLSSHLPRRQAKELKVRESAVSEYVVRIVEDGMAQGCFRAGDPKVTAYAVIGMAAWTSRWFSPTGTLGVPGLADTLFGIAENGIR